jgi:hypothetical protein
MIGRIDATNRRAGPEQSPANLCYPVVAQDPFVAVGLLTETNIRMLGPSLRQVFPIPRDHKFDDLVKALDDACERAPR